METKQFLERIAREGIYTSAKERPEVSQEVIYAGLAFLSVDRGSKTGDGSIGLRSPVSSSPSAQQGGAR